MAVIPRFRSLHVRLLAAAALVTSLTFALLLAASAELLEHSLRKQAELRMRTTGQLLEAALVTPLAEHDYATIGRVVAEAVRNGAINYALVVDSQRRTLVDEGWARSAHERASDIAGPPQHLEAAVDISIAGQRLGTAYYGVSLAFLTEARADLLSRSAVGGGAAMLIAMLVLFWIGHRLTRPLARLTDAARQIGEGNFDAELPVTSTGEIGQLAGALRTMAEALRSRLKSLEERTAELDTAVHDLESFSYAASHDLRASIGAINAFAYLLRRDEAARLSDQGKAMLQIVERDGQHMAALLDRLLEFSRLGRLPSARVSVSMETLVRDAIGKLETAPGTEIQIDALPACEGDPTLLGQVWANLLGNAFKYSRIRVAAKVAIGYDEQSGAYFIRDNGVGFDMRYAEKIFKVFERLHSDGKFEGTGIGLAIAERIVRAHGGRIWADSRPDEGACFWFTIRGEAASALAA